MCGIAGFYSRVGLEPYWAKALGRAFLYYASTRGNQSGGAFVDGRIAKRATEPYKFALSDEFGALFPDDAVAHVGLFHTRQPTSGGRGDTHAQPFVNGAVATAHNGVITNEHELRVKFGIDNPSGVDSELVTSFVAKHGISKLAEFIEAMDGSAALAMVVDERLYLARHSNPLSYTYVTQADGSKVLAFASTGEILMNALRYIWLLPAGTSPSILRENQAFRVKTGELREAGPAANPFVQVEYDWRGASAKHGGYEGNKYSKRVSVADRLALDRIAAKDAEAMGAKIELASDWGYWRVSATGTKQWFTYSEHLWKLDTKLTSTSRVYERHNGRWGYWEPIEGVKNARRFVVSQYQGPATDDDDLTGAGIGAD